MSSVPASLVKVAFGPPRDLVDPPLSEYRATLSLDREEAAIGRLAAHRELNEVPVQREGDESDYWPQPRSDDDPISIQLVRAADGPGDDQWTVVYAQYFFDISAFADEARGTSRAGGGDGRPDRDDLAHRARAARVAAGEHSAAGRYIQLYLGGMKRPA